MQTNATTIARIDTVLDQGDWQPRGLAALELSYEPVVENHAELIVLPRDRNGRYRSNRSDIAFSAA